MEIGPSVPLTPPPRISAPSPVASLASEPSRIATETRPPDDLGDPDSETTVASLSMERDIIIDPATREVVFRTIDQRSGEIVQQVPDRALLRIRAYANELRNAAVESLIMQSA